MNRRGFLSALTVAAGTVFVPKFEGWFRQGSGILTREVRFDVDSFYGKSLTGHFSDPQRDINAMLRIIYEEPLVASYGMDTVLLDSFDGINRTAKPLWRT